MTINEVFPNMRPTLQELLNTYSPELQGKLAAYKVRCIAQGQTLKATRTSMGYSFARVVGQWNEDADRAIICAGGTESCDKTEWLRKWGGASWKNGALPLDGEVQ